MDSDIANNRFCFSDYISFRWGGNGSAAWKLVVIITLKLDSMAIPNTESKETSLRWAFDCSVMNPYCVTEHRKTI